MKTRSDYAWEIHWLNYADEEVPILMIVDLNKGRMSVTNDVENVLAAIDDELTNRRPLSTIRPIKAAPSVGAMPIMYRDSDHAWDEVIVSPEGEFCRFSILRRGAKVDELQREVTAKWAFRRYEEAKG